jgi:NADH-quinone oxidoreductase subunit H
MFAKNIYILLFEYLKLNYFMRFSSLQGLVKAHMVFSNVQFSGSHSNKFFFNKYFFFSFNLLTFQSSINFSVSFFDIKYFFFSLINSIMSYLGSIILVVCLLICIAYYTLLERKLMSAMQRRKGPNVVGFYGFLQPLADGLKLFIKQMLIPMQSNKFLFVASSIYTFAMALGHWVIMPINPVLHLTNLKFGLLYSMVFLSLNVYGLIVSGWSSNSKYAFLGSIRATAQMISYELALSFILLIVFAIVGDLNYYIIILSQKKMWFLLPLLPLFYIFIVIMLAETNRTPFDLAEAEAELVAGFNVEYSGILFALFFLAEYSNMLIMCILGTFLFLGGWFFFNISGYINFLIKILFFAIVYIWVRATLPRYRYDQLMGIGWKIFLPFMVAFFFFVVGILITFNMLPVTQDYPFINQKLLTLFNMNKPLMLDVFSDLDTFFDYQNNDLLVTYLLNKIEEEFIRGYVTRILYENFCESFFSTPHEYIKFYSCLHINNDIFFLAVEHSFIRYFAINDEFDPKLFEVFSNSWLMDFFRLLIFHNYVISPDLELTICSHVYTEGYHAGSPLMQDYMSFIKFLHWRDFQRLLMNGIITQFYEKIGGVHDTARAMESMKEALYLSTFNLTVVPIDVLSEMYKEMDVLIQNHKGK